MDCDEGLYGVWNKRKTGPTVQSTMAPNVHDVVSTDVGESGQDEKKNKKKKSKDWINHLMKVIASAVTKKIQTK